MKLALFIETPSTLAKLIEENLQELGDLLKGYALEKIVLATPDDTAGIAKGLISGISFIEVREYRMIKISDSHARAANVFFQIEDFAKYSHESKWAWPVDNASDFLDCDLWIRFSKDIARKGSRAFLPIVPTYLLGGCLLPNSVFENAKPKDLQRLRSVIRSSTGFIVSGCESPLFTEALRSAQGTSVIFECPCRIQNSANPMQYKNERLSGLNAHNTSEKNRIGLAQALKALLERALDVQKSA